jgi:uncharacterized membrane protein HdeD (DUF308 family)
MRRLIPTPKRKTAKSSQTQSETLNQDIEECMRLHKCWAWFLCLGVALVLMGAAAVSYAALATAVMVVVLGYLLLAGGIVEIVNTFLAGTWRGFFLHLLGGIVHLDLGGFMIDRPERTAEVLTVVLAVAFMVGGLFRIAGAVTRRFAGWPWVLLNGVVTPALGVLIWRQWPESAYWVIGLFAGIDLIFNGWSWIMLGLTVRAVAPRTQSAETKAPLAAAVPVQ